MRKLKLLLFFYVGYLVQTKAQNINLEIVPGHSLGYDSGFVKSFKNNFVVTLVNESKYSTIEVVYILSRKVLNYRTNELNTWGFGFDYKWFTFEYTTRMPWFEPNPIYGNVKNNGVGFGITARKMNFRFFYQNYEGYYLENTSEWFPQRHSNNYYLRNDIQTRTYYSKLSYVFNNKKFSNNAALWQLERQEKRAGSLVVGINYLYNTFHADSSMIPYQSNTLPVSSNTFFALNSLGGNIGYLGTIPFGKRKKLFLTGAIIPGLSWQWGQLSVEGKGIEKDNSVLGFQSEVRFGLGFNGDLWYFGSIARSYNNLNNLDGNEPISIDNYFGRVYVGYRFKQIKHQSKWLKKIGL